MQTVKQTINDLSYVLGVPHSRVTSIARALIDAGVLPKSSGRAIERIDAVQLCGFVAAVAMSDKVEEAADMAKRFMDVRLQGEEGRDTFKAAFSDQITTSNHLAEPVITLGKTRGGITATIEGHFIYQGDLSEGSLPFYENTSWNGWTRSSVTIAKEGVVILRNLFQKTYDADDRPVHQKVSAI